MDLLKDIVRNGRAAAAKHVSYVLDNTLAIRNPLEPIPENARLVVYSAGFEPLTVAVFSYLGGELDEDEAEEIATDYLLEINWFSDPTNTEPLFVF